jgi:hypothetical protein
MTITYFQADSQKENNAIERVIRFLFRPPTVPSNDKGFPPFNATLKHYDFILLTSFNLRDWSMAMLVLLIWE